MRADAAKAGLHFVGDADAAGRAHVAEGRGHVRVGKDDLPATAHERFTDEGGDPAPVGFDLLYGLRHVAGECASAGGAVAKIRAAVGVGHDHFLYEGWATLAAGAVVLVGAHFDERLRMAVIGYVQRDDILAPGGGACQPQGQVVGLAAGVDEVKDAQLRRQGGGETASVLQNRVVQVARVGVEHLHLALAGADHVRVAVAHMRNVVDAIEVGTAGVVIEILRQSAHHLDRLAIGDAQVAAQARFAFRQRCLRGRRLLGETFGGNPKQHVGVG